MKAKTKLRRLLSLLLTLVMLASLLPVMGTTASAAETGGTINEYLYIDGEYQLKNGTYITEDAPTAPQKFESEEKLPSDKTYAALNNDTLYLKGDWGGAVGIMGPKYVKKHLTNPLNIVVMGDTTIRNLDLRWNNTAKEDSGVTIELRDNATLTINHIGSKDSSSAINAMYWYTADGNNRWLGSDITVKGTGTLKVNANISSRQVSPFVKASMFSITENVNLDAKVVASGDIANDQYYGFSLDRFVIDTTGYVKIDTSGYANALMLPAATNRYQLKNASSITLTSSKKETMFMGGNGDLVQLFIDRRCAGWNVDRPAADDATPYTLKLTRGTMPTAAELTVGDNPSVKNIGSAIPSVTVNGGETVSVKASVTLPVWLSDMYKDGRVKLGDSGTLSIYKGSSLSASDKLTGITVPDDLSGSVVSYSTSFTPEAGKTYTTYAIIPIVTVKDGKQLGSASVIATIKAAEKPVLPVLDGSIVYTSGVKYGSDVTIGRTGMLNTISDKLNYQWQYGTGGKWRIISGVTGSMLPAEKMTADMIGKQLRLKVTADGYEGVVYSEAKTVAKATWDQVPVPPALTCENRDSSSIVNATNYKADQQYLLTSKPMTDEQLAATNNWGNFTGSSSAANGYTFYIYTRMAETDTHSAGTIYRYSSVYTGKEVLLKNLTLEGYSAYGVNSTVYVKVGETVTIPVVKEPFNANTWNNFTVKTPTETSAFKVISPTSTVVSGSEIKSITIKGEAVGSEYLGAYYGSGTGTYYGQWNIKVYDPNNITSFDVIDPPMYGDVTLSVGDSYTPDKKTPSVSEIKTNPADALNGYTLKWFVGTGSSYSGRAYGAENEYVKIDQTTGEITAKKATGDCDSVYKSVLLRAVKGNSTKDIAYYSVAVTTAPVIALESISVLPGTKTLKIGESAALSAIKTPVNASGEFTWTSSNSGVARVDNTGKVTAVAKGTATITVACGGKTAACTITVIGADHTHTYGARTKLNDEFHSRSCTGCDEALELKAHDFGAWALDKTDTSRHYRQCSQCGHKVYAAHTASDWIVDTAATATTEGVRHKECTVCGCVVETGKIPAIGKLPFEDVSTDAWFYGDVDYAYRNGLMNGTSTTVFSPDTPTTRGMIVTILYRLEKEPAVSANMPFSDVNSGSYYEKAIIWAEENDIVNGYGNGKFGPDDKITREQMAAILWRYAKYIGYDVSSGDKTDLQSYSDASSVSGYAVEAMKWANGEGIIKGITTTTLSPQGNATRAQVAAILHRFCDLIAG